MSVRELRGRSFAITFGAACLVAGWLLTGSAIASTHTSFTISAPAAARLGQSLLPHPTSNTGFEPQGSASAAHKRDRS
jgi:hypothetical protein